MKRRIPIQDVELRTGELELPPEAAHYARQVLRLGGGDEIELFDGDGRAARGTITGLCRDDVMVTIDEVWEVERAHPRITLFQCMPKGDRWELVIEKATELGVNDIVPVISLRTVIKIPESKVDRKLERWHRIALAASRQCGRYHAPDVHAPVDLDEALALDDSALSLLGHPLLASDDLSEVLAGAPDSIAIWVGPEGGFSNHEAQRITEHGARPFTLANTILRSETAGIFAVGLVRHLAGGSA